MKTELKIFNELIDTVVKSSCNNEANITNVELWAKSWKEEMNQALAIPIVVQQSEQLFCGVEGGFCPYEESDRKCRAEHKCINQIAK